jgi:hypothetical protein
MQANPVTKERFMALGLELVGYTNLQRRSNKTNCDAFRRHFGVLPQTCAEMWVDLVNGSSQESPLDLKKGPIHCLLALRFLWNYETESTLSPIFKMSEKTIRKYVTSWVDKIHLLLENKVRIRLIWKSVLLLK